jgi:hypothetical protein
MKAASKWHLTLGCQAAENQAKRHVALCSISNKSAASWRSFMAHDVLSSMPGSCSLYSTNLLVYMLQLPGMLDSEVVMNLLLPGVQQLSANVPAPDCTPAEILAMDVCRQAAVGALQVWPGGLQLGGGVNLDNAKQWLDAGASHVIVTSFVFREGKLEEDKLKALVRYFPRASLTLVLQL